MQKSNTEAINSLKDIVNQQAALSNSLVETVSELISSVNTFLSNHSSSSSSPCPPPFAAVASAVKRSLTTNSEVQEKAKRAVFFTNEEGEDELIAKEDEVLLVSVMNLANDSSA